MHWSIVSLEIYHVEPKVLGLHSAQKSLFCRSVVLEGTTYDVFVTFTLLSLNLAPYPYGVRDRVGLRIEGRVG
jgi:hypothetical protein